MEGLVDAFQRYFEVVLARTEEQVREAQRLRYQVYCLETGFEDPAAHPDGLERDVYDARAVHSLLVHRPTGCVAGSVRLILPDPEDLAAPFPLEEHCGVLWKAAPRGVRGRLGEISRFCISRAFKRRLTEPGTVWGAPPDRWGRPPSDERRVIPHIVIGLIAGGIRLSGRSGVRHWYAVMEPSLYRLLRRFAIDFEQIGPPVEYHGNRIPCYARVDAVMESMRRRRPALWDLATENGRWWPPREPPEQGVAGKPLTVDH
ncbi:MAG: PEP-CTERM/exosortase system-associated acyltransferase [Gammaproteobacteria bacterium]|nr:MAG: PEP-CTERM/exosortase system-associated acyltransferase [Gammaproteobacteria bacterium]